jgi:integrase
LRSRHHAGRLVTVERAADRYTLIWLAMLDANEFAQRHDLPELARFMLATGLRLGEALGVTWADTMQLATPRTRGVFFYPSQHEGDPAGKPVNSKKVTSRTSAEAYSA